MSEIDLKKRRLLQLAGVWGAAGIVGGATPFISSLTPNRSARLQGMPIEVDLSTMKVGDQRTIMWRGKPIWVVKRPASVVSSLTGLDRLLSDPESKVEQQPSYAQNLHRSIRPDYLVLIGICTHLGCSPTYRPEKGSIDPEWPGGFFCSCHGSKFDMAGRVFSGVPAPTNLEVPPHHFLDDNTLVVGSESSSE
ncbi:ubiquinol-cytochrome c reductase iron-sulfur subunit [Candidatus Synchoanobacter obligatus]|uniref:Ubiquinol-cytochrome c reductase iron-sulfur subunit n=1 Tax=Candidatus Synchoanobacter obligatus TaxID=2919597 RepID=A0ABT1L4M2_9GAMM|nr:ubiquinol-cytochrome c reductase iron-sulfur subunit [Candidatus Synchoanobacter obligatus]MCP8352124.1 ubiquinol-cytochrome c reductase iron-sulfur subunit [Candidatus Synchoanobacter obligatus]